MRQRGSCLLLVAAASTLVGCGQPTFSVAFSATAADQAPFTVEGVGGGAPAEVEGLPLTLVFAAERSVVVEPAPWTFSEQDPNGALAVAPPSCLPTVEEDEVRFDCDSEVDPLLLRADELGTLTLILNATVGGEVPEGEFNFRQPLKWWWLDDEDADAVRTQEPDGQATVVLGLSIRPLREADPLVGGQLRFEAGAEERKAETAQLFGDLRLP